MRQVKIGPEGIRGRVDSGMDLEQVIDLACAFFTWLDPGPIVLARDTRPSSPMLACALRSAASASGREVFDCGICPTAIAQHEGSRREVAGVVCITGAHNGASWNGLKLFGRDGQILSPAEGREVLDLWHQEEFYRAPHDKLGKVCDVDSPFEPYLAALLGWVDAEAIRRSGLRIAVDACNGAGALVVRPLCAKLNVELIPLSCDPIGRFPHPPDPTEENLAQLASIVPAVKAHAGFGLSSDCERLGAVTERGQALGRQATLPLYAEHMLGNRTKTPGSTIIVAGVICDSRIHTVAQKHGAQVATCGVGAAAVAERVALEEALCGGDNSGGVLTPSRFGAFDGLATLAALLEAVARDGGLQPLADTLPVVFTHTATVPCPMSRAYSAVAEIRKWARGTVSDYDGVRVDSSRGWYHVRVSHTEPVIRITCEGRSDDDAYDLLVDIRSRVRRALQGL